MAKIKRRNIGVIIFFIVPFLMGTVLGIFIDSKWLNKSKIDNTNSQITDEETIDKLFNIINNNELEKLIYKYRINGISFNKITNDEKLFLAGIDTYYKDDGIWVTYETLKDNLKKKYNSDYGVKSENYNFHDIAVISQKKGSYQNNGKAFTYIDNDIFIDLYKVKDLSIDGDKYFLTILGIYHQILQEENIYTNDKGFDFDDALTKKTNVDELYNKYPNQFIKFQFLFIKEGNNYTLVSFNKI